MQKYLHKCEVCGKEEMLTSDEAHVQGWDYPPHIGTWGVLSPRTCPDCPMSATTWWKVTCEGSDNLTAHDIEVICRIREEVDPD